MLVASALLTAWAAGRVSRAAQVPTPPLALAAPPVVLDTSPRIDAVEARLDRIEAMMRDGDAVTRAEPSSRPSSADLDRHVRRTSPSTWDVDMSLVERVLDQAPLATNPRIVPHERDGRVVGIRIYGIRRDSLLGRLGLENGDTLLSVNGHELSSPDGAISAFSELRATDAVFLSLERRGVPRVHAYRLVR